MRLLKGNGGNIAELMEGNLSLLLIPSSFNVLPLSDHPLEGTLKGRRCGWLSFHFYLC